MVSHHQFRLVEISSGEKEILLKQVRWAEDFSAEELKILVKVMDLFEVNADCAIFRQGAKRLFMCLLIQGEVEILREDFRHENRQIALIGKEQTLGEMSLIDGLPRSASAITQKETTMFVLSKEHFDQLAEEQPRIWGKLLLKICRLMSERLRETSGELVDVLSYIQAVQPADGEEETE